MADLKCTANLVESEFTYELHFNDIISQEEAYEFIKSQYPHFTGWHIYHEYVNDDCSVHSTKWMLTTSQPLPS